MNYETSTIDEVQSHILGVIAGLMTSYSLNPSHVQARYKYVNSLAKVDVTNSYLESLPFKGESEETTEDSDASSEHGSVVEEGKKMSWGDRCMSSDEELDPIEDIDVLYVSTRRQFCNAMQKGIRICPRYSQCDDNQCESFHIRQKHICPHVTKGNFCNIDGCELIVIRACRKGKRCNDRNCSFRHP